MTVADVVERCATDLRSAAFDFRELERCGAGSLTDDTALAQRNADLIRDMLRQAHFVPTDPAEQIAALLTAAIAPIYRQAGPANARHALLELIGRTLDS